MYKTVGFLLLLFLLMACEEKSVPQPQAKIVSRELTNKLPEKINDWINFASLDSVEGLLNAQKFSRKITKGYPIPDSLRTALALSIKKTPWLQNELKTSAAYEVYFSGIKRDKNTTFLYYLVAYNPGFNYLVFQCENDSIVDMFSFIRAGYLSESYGKTIRLAQYLGSNYSDQAEKLEKMKRVFAASHCDSLWKLVEELDPNLSGSATLRTMLISCPEQNTQSDSLIKLVATDPHYCLLLYDYYAKTGKLSKAKTYLEVLESLLPEGNYLNIPKANLEIKWSNFNKADSLIENVDKKYHHDYFYLYTKLDVEIRLKSFKRAVQTLDLLRQEGVSKANLLTFVEEQYPDFFKHKDFLKWKI